MTQSIYPEWVAEVMPLHGSCGFCGGPDARHRVIDAMIERVNAGEDENSVALDYEVPTSFVLRLVSEFGGGPASR